MKKKILAIGIIAILITMLVVLTGCGNKNGEINSSNNGSNSKAEKKLEEFWQNYEANGDAEKLLKCIDWAGFKIMERGETRKSDLEEFDRVYNEELEGLESTLKYYAEKEDNEDNIERLQKYIDGNATSLKEIKSTEKIGNNLYKIDIIMERETRNYGETEKTNQTFYVMEKGGEYYVIYDDGQIIHYIEDRVH